ncbi:MAG: sulfotransferase domain-containing protein, partial [Anaerolineae bacterium]
MKRPQRTRIYDNHSLNSPAWDGYRPRPGDVVITTALKAGTTWMQNIVGNLIFQDEPMPGLVWELTPWLDSSFGSPAEKLAQMEAQTHRRFLKTHLPLDALPYFPEVKYIYVGRDGRDVFMSLWNHYRHLQPDIFDHYNRHPSRRHDPFPPCPADIHDFFRLWISRSWFEWEQDGFPFWSLFYHVRSWWDFRHLPNILFVHFNDLLADLDGQMRRTAAFLDIPVHEATWPALVDKMTFKSMKANADKVVPGSGDFLVGGAERFLNKGTNGRWRGILTAPELAQYEAAVQRQLTPDCRHWLKGGEPPFSGQT